MTLPRSALAALAGLLFMTSAVFVADASAARVRPPIEVLWGGAGAIPDGGGGLEPASSVCAPAPGASAVGNYLHFELYSQRPPASVPTIRFGKGDPLPMTLAHRGRGDVRTYAYVLTSEEAFDIETLLEGGVLASMESLFRSARAARPRLALVKGCNEFGTSLTVHNGGMIDYGDYSPGSWSLVPFGTTMKVCEVSASSLPYTEIGCITFSPSDLVGSIKHLSLSTSPTWIVVSTLGDFGTYSSTGVQAWSYEPTMTEINIGGTPPALAEDIPCDSSATTVPFPRFAGEDIWVTEYNSC